MEETERARDKNKEREKEGKIMQCFDFLVNIIDTNTLKMFKNKNEKNCMQYGLYLHT